MVWNCRKTSAGIESSKVTKLTGKGNVRALFAHILHHRFNFAGLDTSVNSIAGLYWKYKDNIATIVVAVGGSQICVWLREKQDGKFISHFCSNLYLNLFLF